MKSFKLLFVVFIIVFLTGCNEKKDGKFYDEIFLKKNIMEYNPDENFNTVFPEYKDFFNLTDAELKIVGMWGCYDPDINTNGSTVDNFIFYPNKFAIIDYSGVDKNSKGQSSEICGTWYIERNWLKIKIISYKKTTKNDNEWIYDYKKIKPYTVNVSRMESIDSKGFSRKRFELIKLPKELGDYSGNERRQIKQHRFRFFYLFNIGINSPNPPPKIYWNFVMIPYIIENDLKGEDIAQDMAVLKKILNYWEYESSLPLTK